MRAPVHEAKCTSFAHAESMKIQSSDSSFMNPAYSADNLTMNDNQPTADAHEHGDLFRLDPDIQALRVENYSVQDVCKLIASIPTIPLNRVRHYQVNVLKHQIDGKCLLTNEIETIQRSLKMDPDDWQPFLHLLTYFRDVRDVCPHGLIGSQKRETSGIEPSSAVVSMVLRNKQMEGSRTRIGSSSASSTYPIIPHVSAGTVDSGKSTAMVRQTPWLLSPVVATGPNNNDVNTERSTDSISPLADSLCTTENQTSLSGMEEPESLWKPTTTAALCSEMSLTNSFHTKINSRRECKLYRSEDAEIFANADAVKEQYEESTRLPTIFQAGKGDFLKMRSYCPTRNGKRTARKRYPKNGHTCSHSTVDLRMILNHNRKPWSHATDSTGIRNYSEKGNRPNKESYRRASRNRHVVGLEDELLNFQHTPPWKGLGAPVAYQFKRSPCSANSRLRDHHPIKSGITSAVVDDDSTDLRRMRKRLCRRKELTSSDQKQTNLKESFPFPPLLDAEYDYFLPSNVHKMTYGEHQVSKDKSEPQIDLPQSIAHRQLTSLRPHLTYVTRSELGHSLNCLYASSGPNQTTVEASPEALMAASKTQTPPKIPRRNLIEPGVRTTCSNGWIYSSEWSGSRFHPLNSTTSANLEQEFSTRVASKSYIPELCTCNYWYDIEQVMDKTTISEPTLRGYSGESSTDSRHDSNLYTTLHSSADMTESFSEEEHFYIDNERSSSRHSRRSQDRAGDLKRD
ncbi:unnamed protein product [Dicrocoelium dendriticum]|nr:unnamed protein product [Dicrocoelium dendriticum]